MNLDRLAIDESKRDFIYDTDDDDDLIDITKEVFASLESITNNKVVKSPYFELLEGTRALEVLNPKLDTGLIELTREELTFDCSKPQEVNVIINIQTKLLSNLINWLESDSLPVTVLSCRYVQTLLVNYLNHENSGLGKFSFYNSRLSPVDHLKDDLNYQLIHRVLKTFIMGLCKFIGFTIYLSRTVLYEEEDLNTKSMNLNFFDDISPGYFIEEINDCIEWILSNDEIVEADTLITQLKIVANLVKFENTFKITQRTSFMENDSQTSSFGFDFCLDAINQITKLQTIKFDDSVIPTGSFSKFIQIDLENKSIPAELTNINLETTWDCLTNIFKTIHKFTNQANSIKSINQLYDFLQYNVKFPIDNVSVFARGFFQLYFIRDDKSIFGSNNVNLPNLVVDWIENVIGKNTIMLGKIENNLSQIKDSAKAEIIKVHNANTTDLESGMYHYLTTFASNPCRLQQLLSKGLILWDTLQVGWESFEYEMYKGFGVGDEFATGELSISVTSYVYFGKLQMMLELLLNGISLDLYKPFEMYLIYWYADYLILNIIEHLENRVSQILLGKINHLETNIPKKIKKLKAGSKKEQLKELNLYNQQVIIPQLTATLNFNQDYLIKSLKALRNLTQCQLKYLSVLSKLQIIDYTKGPINNLTSMENLYHLRMKPWSSIGVPMFPTFEQYQSALTTNTIPGTNNKVTLMKCLELLASAKNNLVVVEKEYNQLIDYIKRDTKNNFLPDSSIITWYEELISSMGQINDNISQISKIISLNKNDLDLKNKYKISITKGCHKYFPNISIISCTV